MDLLAELGTILPEDRVVFARDDLQRHGGGVFTYHTPVQPDAVVYPQSRDEVVEILRFANEHRIPIVPFGQGSSLEAHTLPVHGGISPASPTGRSTRRWPSTDSSFRWTPAGTPRWAGWPAPTLAGRTRSSTGLCGIRSSASKWCSAM